MTYKTPRLYPQAGDWSIHGKKDRRKPSVRRILWETVQTGVNVKEQRKDNAVREVLRHAKQRHDARELPGLMLVMLRNDGKAELVSAGAAYDLPMCASGLANALSTAIDNWARDQLDEVDAPGAA